MRDRGASLAGRISKLTFTIQASCLAKERCIPETDISEKNMYAWRRNLLRNVGFSYITPACKTPFLGVFKILVSKASLLPCRLVRENFFSLIASCMRQNATEAKLAPIQSVY
jgi:hypothetical protein